MAEKEKKFLTSKEASDYLSVSISCIQRYCHFKVIPYYRPQGSRGRIYFLKEDLDNFILGGRISSKAEIKEKAQIRLHEMSER